MTQASRPIVRDLFVNLPKRLDISFYTSNTDKFLQARMVFQEFGLSLKHFTSSQEPYKEDYKLGRDRLLAAAIEEVKRKLGVNSVFFVEDTSVRIAALSTSSEDIPGLAVKEWFANTTFENVDSQLKLQGKNRSATVRSDIALHLPHLRQPVLLHAETHGRIAETPPMFAPSDQYPWLTPDTFNGWFIPEDSSKRLGEMSFEESWQYDFRIRAFELLIARLEEYSAILNLPSSSYSLKRARANLSGPLLFKEEIPLFVVVGRVCAGKTTFAQYVCSRHDSRFIEASSQVRKLATENGIQPRDDFDVAWELLRQKGPDIVARHIVGTWGDELREGAVITGFRTIEEVQFIRTQYPGCKLILVDASERTRFERHLKRGRLRSVKTIQEFRHQDQKQSQFGLLQVASELADLVLENEGTMDQYHAQIEAILSGRFASIAGVSPGQPKSERTRNSRLFRCLQALEGATGPISCTEISSYTGQQAKNEPKTKAISSRHVNWVLRDYPELARRVDARRDTIRYELLPAGKAYLTAMRQGAGQA